MSADWVLNDVVVRAEGEDKRILLNGVNACFAAGKITLLIGSNGAGKSTLLETLAGVRSLQSGTIELGGESLWMARGRRQRLNWEATLRLGIAMQQSESQWFAATVRRELDYSLKPYDVRADEAERRITEAMQQTGLELELLERDPWTLSGGQQRRLSLACLLACEPDWLLLDEPTAGLDADGVRRLCAVLAAHRAQGRGAVVATHDLDALLPLADAVAVVSGGTVRAAAPAAAMEHAAVAPQALRALTLLRSMGAAEPPGPPAADGGGALWPEPRELAAQLAAKLAPARASSREPGGRRQSPPELPRLRQPAPMPAVPQALGQSHARLRPDRFDPRAIIISYLLLTAGVLAQSGWLQLLAAALLSAALIAVLWPLVRPWLRVIRAFAIFAIILSFIGGLSVSPLDFQWAKAEPTAIRLGQLIIITLLGMPMLKLMTPLRLQRAIEQTFGWLNRLHVPIYSLGLMITLIFRFIPLLTGEWGRFAKLAHARGKAVSPPGAIPVKMLRTMMIPYLRSILHMAEQMADALEVRGYGNLKRTPTFGFRLRFGVSDAVMLGAASGGCALLYAISKFI